MKFRVMVVQNGVDMQERVSDSWKDAIEYLSGIWGWASNVAYRVEQIPED